MNSRGVQLLFLALILITMHPAIANSAIGCLEKDGFLPITNASMEFRRSGSQIEIKGRISSEPTKRPKKIRLILSSDPWLNLPIITDDINQKGLVISTYPVTSLLIEKDGRFELPLINIDNQVPYYGFLQSVGCEKYDEFEGPSVLLKRSSGEDEIIELPTEANIRGQVVSVGAANLYVIRIPAVVAPVSDPVFVTIDGSEYSTKDILEPEVAIASALNGAPKYARIGADICLIGSGIQLPTEITIKRRVLYFFRKEIGGLLLSSRAADNIGFLGEQVITRHSEYLPTQTGEFRKLSAALVFCLFGKSIDGGVDFSVFDRTRKAELVDIASLISFVKEYSSKGVARGIQLKKTGAEKFSIFTDAFVKIPISVIPRGGKSLPEDIDLSNLPIQVKASWIGQVAIFKKKSGFSKIETGVECNRPEGAEFSERVCESSSIDISDLISDGWWAQVDLAPTLSSGGILQPGPFGFSIEATNNGIMSQIAYKGAVTTDPLLLKRTRKRSFKSTPSGNIMETEDVFAPEYRPLWLSKGYSQMFKLGKEYSSYRLTNVTCDSKPCPPPEAGSINIDVNSVGEVNFSYPFSANDNLPEISVEFDLNDPIAPNEAERIIISKLIKPFNGTHIVVSGYSKSDAMGKLAKDYAKRYVDELMSRGVLAERISGFDYPLRTVVVSSTKTVQRNGISLSEIEDNFRGIISGLTYFGHSYSYNLGLIGDGDAAGGPMLGNSIDLNSFEETNESIPRTKPKSASLKFSPNAVVASFACNSASPVVVDGEKLNDGWHYDFARQWGVDASGTLGWTFYAPCKSTKDLACVSQMAGIPGILTTTEDITVSPSLLTGLVGLEYFVRDDGVYFQKLRGFGFPRMELTYLNSLGIPNRRLYLPDEFIQPKILQ